MRRVDGMFKLFADVMKGMLMCVGPGQGDQLHA